jgi:Flp pilus assembly protein CpaB
MTYRTRNILIASGLALLAIVFMFIYISKVRHQTDAGKQLVAVFVAAHDIQEGTQGSGLISGGLIEKRVPRKAVVPGAISSPSQVKDLIATQETLRGEQVTGRRFGPIAAAGVRASVTHQQRVVQLAGTANQVLDGTLKAGDHVDIVGTWNVPEKCTTCHVSRTIVRDVLVLKTSADLSLPTSSNGVGQDVPVQLRLTDAQVERVLWVTNNGDWWLDLRPVVKPGDSRQGYDSARTLLSNGLNRNGPSR